jgi:DNA polymerase/3'-5' exonuclease PolX
MNLATTQKLAEKILAELTPYCDQIEIAGSIRRRRPNPNDIDLVCLPKPGNLIELQSRFHARCKVLSEGVENAMYLLGNGVQLDVFFAHHEARDIFGEVQAHANFGTLLLCRTGSAQHNIWLIGQAKHKDLYWKPYASPPQRRRESSPPSASNSSPRKRGSDNHASRITNHQPPCPPKNKRRYTGANGVSR